MMDDPDGRRRTLDALETARRIASALAGKPCEVQGAVLADLVACWLSSFVGAPPGQSVDALRDEVFVDFVKLVHDLVPIHDRHAAGHG